MGRASTFPVSLKHRLVAGSDPQVFSYVCGLWVGQAPRVKPAMIPAGIRDTGRGHPAFPVCCFHIVLAHPGSQRHLPCTCSQLFSTSLFCAIQEEIAAWKLTGSTPSGGLKLPSMLSHGLCFPHGRWGDGAEASCRVVENVLKAYARGQTLSSCWVEKGRLLSRSPDEP